MKRLKKISKIAFGAACVFTLFVVGTAPRNVFYPYQDPEYARVSVSIEINNRGSGGSGVILSSTKNESIILTNKHVCNLVKDGGKVIQEQSIFEVKELKPYPKHDLCLIKVFHSFGVNIKLAQKRPTLYSAATIVGHPALMPTIISRGHFSGRETIPLVVGFRPCNEKDIETYGLFCIFMGGVPVIKKFESQVISSQVMPGSSGSPVFNSDGELSGVVFASRSQEISYAYIVPFEYVYDFIKTESLYPWIKTDDKGRKSQAFQNGSLNHSKCFSITQNSRLRCPAIFNIEGGQ